MQSSILLKYFRNNEKILFSSGFELESTTLSNNTVDIVSSVIFIQWLLISDISGPYKKRLDLVPKKK